MEVYADQVVVTGAHGRLLEPTSLRVRPGEVAVVAGEPNAGHTAFGLALTGRITPSGGSVTPSADELRAHAVLVDAPEVTAPEPNLRVADVIAEELALAGARSGRSTVAELLTEHGLEAGTRFEDVPGGARVALLTELAARRPGAELLVLDTPDRHSSNPADWLPTAMAQARDGRAVVVLCGTSTALRLPVTPARLGESDQPAPLEPTL
ncbi:ABC-type multidrug transport system ATPase subunit [Actinokineospora baliensis]|uniref:hypothetical protein n=1 Tax=Actinokineospora baliensis TaxID=547056 RepID=UPI0019582158|nr:hypothetical protein [Actinokineospora baliensis]MBM7775468.1 ABC-type multidrug transport system ATPase subunit [Actinokineospora baliensis]